MDLTMQQCKKVTVVEEQAHLNAGKPRNDGNGQTTTARCTESAAFSIHVPATATVESALRPRPQPIRLGDAKCLQ